MTVRKLLAINLAINFTIFIGIMGGDTEIIVVKSFFAYFLVVLATVSLCYPNLVDKFVVLFLQNCFE